MADENDININIGVNPTQAESGARRTRTALNSVTKEQKEMDAALRRLKSSIDPTFAATEKYNKTLADNKRLLDAGRISQQEYAAGAKAAKAALDQQITSINRLSAASQSAAQMDRQAKAEQAAAARRAAQEEVAAARLATQEKINQARKERAAKAALEQQERQAIRLAAQMARQAALEAQRSSRPVSARAVGSVAPGSIAPTRSIAQLENDIQRAMGKITRLTQEAEAAAARAASASSVHIARVAEGTAQRRAQLASETRDRVLQMERELASQQGALAQQAAAEVRAAKDAERRAAREAAQAAVQAAKERRAADAQAAASAREAARAVAEQAKAERQSALAAQELRASIDPAYAAQQRYNDVMARATQLLMQNKLQQGEWTRIQQQAKAQMDVNVRSMGQMNSMYVQLGYQAQDVTASLASGINPLVILAQQGGQTAAALSTMGGTVGKVAAFMAGPWGAAIIGFTMLIGLMMGKTKDAEKATLDLIDAEKVRTASLEDLTKALEDFNREQERANTNNREALELDRQRAGIGAAEAERKLGEAQQAVETAQTAYDNAWRMAQNASMGHAGEAARGALAMAESRLKAAQRTLKEAQGTYELARKAQQQVEIRTVRGNAEAATDEREAIRNRYMDEETRLQRIYEQETKNLHPVRDRNALLAAQARLQGGLEAAMRRRTREEEALSEAAKRTNNAYGEGVQVFRSRAQALQMAGRELQGQGLVVDENPLFGGITPGAHRSSHQNAIDINVGEGVMEADDPGTRARFDQIARSYQARGYRVLWNGRIYEPGGDGPGPMIPRRTGTASEQHTNHMHLEAPASIVGKPTMASTGAFDRGQQNDAFDAYIEDLEYQKQAAEDNYELILEIQDKKIGALRSYHGDESQEVIRATRERMQIERRRDQALLQQQRESISARLQLAEIALSQEQQLQENARGMQEDVVDFAESNGLISEQQALQERAALLDQEYQQQVAHENRMFALRAQAIRDQLALQNLPVEQRRQLNAQLEQLEAEHQARMAGMQASYGRQVAQTQMQSANISLTKWRDVAQTMTQSFGSAFQGLWTRSMTFQQAFIQMADQMVYKFVDMGLKMFQDWVMRQIGMTAVTQAQEMARTATTTTAEAARTGAVVAGQATQTGARATAAATEATINAATVGGKIAAEAIKTGAAVTGAATQTSVAAAAGMGELTTNAAVAAAGAYKSTVVIPFIGPVAAPAAAALALAAVLGFGAMISARGGQGEVPMDGQLSMLHKKEMVLPEKFAVPLRAALTARTSSGMIGAASMAGSSVRDSMTTNQGDNANFYYQPNHTNMGASMETLLRQDGRTLRKWLKNEMRNGGLKFSR